MPARGSPQARPRVLVALPYEEELQGFPHVGPDCRKISHQTYGQPSTCNHLRWLGTMSETHYMFLARGRSRKTGRHGVHFSPNVSSTSQMSTSSFRYLLRFALVKCCGLSWAQAKLFGSHSPCIGAMYQASSDSNWALGCVDVSGGCSVVSPANPARNSMYWTASPQPLN